MAKDLPHTEALHLFSGLGPVLKNLVFVAVDNYDFPIGALWASRKDGLYDFHIAVCEKYRKNGIGAELCQMALHEASALNLTPSPIFASADGERLFEKAVYMLKKAMSN